MFKAHPWLRFIEELVFFILFQNGTVLEKLIDNTSGMICVHVLLTALSSSAFVFNIRCVSWCWCGKEANTRKT